MGYLEKAEADDSFFFAGLVGYRKKAEDEDSFFLAGLMGYRGKTFFLTGFLSGTVWTGTLFWNCCGYG